MFCPIPMDSRSRVKSGRPDKPGGQRQANLCTPIAGPLEVESVQVAPLRQGALAHSSTSRPQRPPYVTLHCAAYCGIAPGAHVPFAQPGVHVHENVCTRGSP